jgi:hypothetical protein
MKPVTLHDRRVSDIVSRGRLRLLETIPTKIHGSNQRMSCAENKLANAIQILKIFFQVLKPIRRPGNRERVRDNRLWVEKKNRWGRHGVSRRL